MEKLIAKYVPIIRETTPVISLIKPLTKPLKVAYENVIIITISM